MASTVIQAPNGSRSLLFGAASPQTGTQSQSPSAMPAFPNISGVLASPGGARLPSLPIPAPVQLSAEGESEEDSSDTNDSDGEGFSVAHRLSAHVMGWGAVARFQRHASVAEMREQGMSTGQANAQAVAQHRNEVLFALYSKYIMFAAVMAVFLSVTVCGLFIWHMCEFWHYRHVKCNGSLRVMTRVVLGISIFDILMGTRVCCTEVDETSLPRRWRMKDCCIVLLLLTMGLNVWGVLSLSAAQISGVADVSLLPNCSDAAPGLYMATVAHGVGLVVYSVYLLISFIGVGNLLETLLRRGLLTSPNGAPKGCLEDCTVEVTEIEDGYECPICLEECTPETTVMTKECHHIFHKDCLQHWLQVNSTCPLCRQSLARHN
ncbi:rnf126 [Symbiodinium sp. CCMP2456]|nr:rnf126 [Symbiodinium sp. CCMP2456]